MMIIIKIIIIIVIVIVIITIIIIICIQNEPLLAAEVFVLHTMWAQWRNTSRQ